MVSRDSDGDGKGDEEEEGEEEWSIYIQKVDLTNCRRRKKLRGFFMMMLIM